MLFFFFFFFFCSFPVSPRWFLMLGSDRASGPSFGPQGCPSRGSSEFRPNVAVPEVEASKRAGETTYVWLGPVFWLRGGTFQGTDR